MEKNCTTCRHGQQITEDYNPDICNNCEDFDRHEVDGIQVERVRILGIIQKRIDDTQAEIDKYDREYPDDDHPDESHIENMVILAELRDLHNTIDPPVDGEVQG